MEKRSWTVSFDENGGEYTGHLTVTAVSVIWVNSHTFKADDIEIELDERIISID